MCTITTVSWVCMSRSSQVGAVTGCSARQIEGDGARAEGEGDVARVEGDGAAEPEADGDGVGRGGGDSIRSSSVCSSGHWMLLASGGTCCRRGSGGGMRGDGVGGGSAGGVGDARAEADGAQAEGDGARAKAMSRVGRRFFPTYPRWRAFTSVVRAGSLSLVTQFARRSRESTRHARVATKRRVVAVTMDAVRSMHATKGRTSASKIESTTARAPKPMA